MSIVGIPSSSLLPFGSSTPPWHLFREKHHQGPSAGVDRGITGQKASSTFQVFWTSLKNKSKGASLVAQWLRVCLPMQGTRVRALVWEDPTCRGAAGPVSHNYWACASWSLCSATREATIVRGLRIAMKSGPRLPQLEKALAQKRRPNTAINK